MEMMRISSFALAASLSVGSMAGCGGSSEDDGTAAYDAWFQQSRKTYEHYQSLSITGEGSDGTFSALAVSSVDNVAPSRRVSEREGRCWFDDAELPATSGKLAPLDGVTFTSSQGVVAAPAILPDVYIYITEKVSYALSPGASVVMAASEPGGTAVHETVVLPSDKVVASAPTLGSTFDPTRDIELTWTGAGPSTVVEVYVSVQTNPTKDTIRLLSVTCLSEPGAGSARIPVSFLRSFPLAGSSEAATATLFQAGAGVWNHRVVDGAVGVFINTTSASRVTSLQF